MTRSIRANIIISFVAFSLISLVLVGAISIGFISIIGQTTINRSSNALKDQIQDNVKQTADQNALIINRKLSNAEALVNAMAEECVNLFKTDSPFKFRQPYYDYFFEFDRGQELFPNDTYLDQQYGIYLSWSYASWYIPQSNSSNYLQLLAADPSLNDTVNRVSNMDYIFQAIHENAPEIRWLYIAFETTNLFINYPGSAVGGTNNERNADPFVSTAEEWYTDVRSGNGKIVFTAPYFDPIDGALLITIGKAIYHPVQNTLIGCIFADITIESIKEKILDIDILESGYAVLIQESGLVVAHPEWTAPNPNVDLPTIDQVEVNLNGLSAISQPQLTVITSGSTGVIEYERDQEDRYLAYAPVDKGDYICLIIVPVDEAIASVGVLAQRIDAQTVTTIVQALIIILVAVVLSITIGIWISNRIIRPITHLTQIASKMATDQVREDLLGELDLQIDSELEKQADEVGDLTRAFKGMLNSLKQEKKEAIQKLDDSFWDE